ncbi:bacillithiol system redox-active protein YtxJ [Fulvivirga sp. 29W222]|uniref:Bacillithiol system redox-active protein YtxJ n=1 Tax=Fulvivirga marina TaxID=2494733 RepID=A0A937FXY3_9BACT|nr:bacillithiol system redox-active protein YtxJ [Fulvivirga marina]MBL6444971.1 bacillithiol system redox-active protein YtxJ [Fulvivirga marina]
MNWIQLNSSEDLERIKEESRESPVVIFKHSTRCSISDMALNRLERSWSDQDMVNVKPYYLDLISNRNVSDEVAEVFKVRHESPQVLIVKNGEVIHSDSHMGINYNTIKDLAKN